MEHSFPRIQVNTYVPQRQIIGRYADVEHSQLLRDRVKLLGP